MNETSSIQIAKHFKEIYFGGNWTASNLKENLSDVSWEEATTKLNDCNTIITLVFHIHYYVAAVLKVLHGEPLEAKDQYSFDHPPIESEEDWNQMLAKIWLEGAAFSAAIEQLPAEMLFEPFTHEKYGNYYRNLLGIIEHSHYHLGQIAILKKIIRQQNTIPRNK